MLWSVKSCWPVNNDRSRTPATGHTVLDEIPLLTGLNSEERVPWGSDDMRSEVVNQKCPCFADSFQNSCCAVFWL